METIEENIAGTVVFFLDDRGYGFIRRDDCTTDVFIHFKNIKTIDHHRTLYEGQRCIFNVEHTPKGQKALECVPIMSSNLFESLSKMKVGGGDGNADKIQ